MLKIPSRFSRTLLTLGALPLLSLGVVTAPLSAAAPVLPNAHSAALQPSDGFPLPESITNLLTPQGQRMDILRNRTWHLVGHPKAELRFLDGRANGNDACNVFNASYTVHGSTISFGPAMSTRMYCQNTLHTQRRVAEMLRSPNTFTITTSPDEQCYQLIMRPASNPAHPLVYTSTAKDVLPASAE